MPEQSTRVYHREIRSRDLNLNLEVLRSFLAVADHGNITAAAQAVGKTQSTISTHIQRMEAVYDCTLDTVLIMAADTIAGYIQGLLDGVEFKQTAYAFDRTSRKAALSQFLQKAMGESESEGQVGSRRAA